jgi:hypothetical protein
VNAQTTLASSVRHAVDAQREVRLRYGWPTETSVTDADDTDDSGGTWVRCADLLADPAPLADWTRRLADWLDREYGEAPDRTVAGYLLSWYLTVPAQVGALLFHTTRRVPLLDPASLAVRFGPDHPRPDAIALLDDRFACLADDPAATDPAATPVADDAALAAVLRERYAAHAQRFLTAVAGPSVNQPVCSVRLGRRTLWALATDALDGAFWRIGQFCGNEGAGAANAALALPAVLPPFTSASTLRPVDPDSVTEGWTRRRDSCCFHYVLRDGMGPCATCPRVLGR